MPVTEFSELADWVAVTDIATGKLLTVTRSLTKAANMLGPGTCFAIGRDKVFAVANSLSEVIRFKEERENTLCQ